MPVPQNANFPDHVSGNTYNGRTFNVRVNNVAVDLTNAQIDCYFRQSSPSGPVMLHLSAGQGITVTNNAGGIFQINKQIIPLPAGTYYFAIRITFQNGDVKTYISGKWNIIASITI